MQRQTGLALRRSELIEIPISSSNFLLVIPKSSIEACKQRPTTINSAGRMQQQYWRRVTSENNAILELMTHTDRLVQLQMLTTLIVLLHKSLQINLFRQSSKTAFFAIKFLSLGNGSNTLARAATTARATSRALDCEILDAESGSNSRPRLWNRPLD
jgi:hypothetical protein